MMNYRWHRISHHVMMAIAVITAILGITRDSYAPGKDSDRGDGLREQGEAQIPDASWKIGEGLAEILTSELSKTGQFIVVERQAVGDIVKEQELGMSGLVRQGTAAQTGQMLGAQIVVRGAVTEFEERASGGGVGVQSRSFGIEGGASNAQVALDIRLIDASTGQIIASHNAVKTASSAGGSFGARSGSVTFGGDIFFRTPLGQATRAALQDALQFIMVTSFKAVPFLNTTFRVRSRQGSSFSEKHWAAMSLGRPPAHLAWAQPSRSRV
jgi:curli biogenesis system outer membrane secretion channel CsgG